MQRKILWLGVVKEAPPEFLSNSFHSYYFLILKKKGGWWPILDLSFQVSDGHPFLHNPFLRAHKLICNSQLARLVLPLSIHPAHRKYLGFTVNRLHLQFRVLPFSLSTAPRALIPKWVPITVQYLVSTEVLSSHSNIWLIIGQVNKDVCTVPQLLSMVGLRISQVKSTSLLLNP